MRNQPTIPTRPKYRPDMARKFAVKYLPKHVLSALNQRLIDAEFSNWDSHVQWLLSQGYSVARASLHRYGVATKAKHEQAKNNPTYAQARMLCLKIAAAKCENASSEELIAYADQLLRWVET